MTTEAPTDRDILAFEQRFYLHYGAKVTAIRDELGLGEVAYWQRLNAIIDQPAPDLARDFGPLLNRLLRVLEARVGQKRAS